MKVLQQLMLYFVLLNVLASCGATTSETDPTPIEPNSFRLAEIMEIPGLSQHFLEPILDLNLDAESALLIHADTNDVLYEDNSDVALPVASMSKIMTELLVLEAIDEGDLDWEDIVPISDYAYSISNHPGYASVLLKKETSYTVQELFSAMAIRSANGATIALSEAVADTEEAFVHAMNEKAKNLGLTNSIFVNSTGLTNSDLGDFYSVGLPADSNLMSAKDVGKLATHVMDTYPELLEVADQTEFNFHGDTFKNSNWMLPGSEVDLIEEDITFDGVNGLKTGYTKEAGYCFTGSVEIGNERFISVVMGTSSFAERFLETRRLYHAVEQQLEVE